MKAAALLLLLTAAQLHANERWVNRTLRSMTLDQKIGQLLMVQRGEQEETRRAITEFHVGSVHAGVGEAATIARTLNELQRLSRFPLLVCANEEGGPGYALYGATRMPLAMAIAATSNEQLAYEVAKVAAIEGRAIGVNVNFYPVADVNNNPRNPIINLRSFGEDPARVSRFVTAYIRGIQENGQLATAKHFPGHGDVDVDSHLEMPVLNVTRQRLNAIELPPFRAAIDAGVGGVMTAHIWLPQLEPEKNLPATLSRNILSGLLRGDLRFRGLIFTDAMRMKGVTNSFENGDAAVRAIEAGADILVGSPSVEDSFLAIKSAVREGRISEVRIEASVRRILRAKASLGLTRPEDRLVDLSAMMWKIGTAEHRALAQRIADAAITLVKDDQKVLPLRPSPEAHVVQINVLDTRSGWREGPVGRVLAAELPKRFPRTVTVQIDDQSTPAEYDLVRTLAQSADVLVVNGFVRVADSKGSIDLSADQTRLLRDLIALKKPLAYTAFGSPYVLTHVPELPMYAVTYDTDPTAEMAAVKALTGEIPFQGRLPINLPGLYPPAK